MNSDPNLVTEAVDPDVSLSSSLNRDGGDRARRLWKPEAAVGHEDRAGRTPLPSVHLIADSVGTGRELCRKTAVFELDVERVLRVYLNSPNPCRRAGEDDFTTRGGL